MNDTSEPEKTDAGTSADSAGVDTTRFWTIPNILCLIRLFGSPLLIVLGVLEDAGLFLPWFLFMAMTDWVDGKLAVLLRQRTTFGARLDSWADATYYTCLTIGLGWLLRDTILAEWVWIAAAGASYALTTGAGLWKFGRWPSYHTRMAKISWGLVTIAAISLLLDWSIWPMRIACLSVIITNLEATAITLTLPEWQADVLNWFRARKLARQLREAGRPSSDSASDGTADSTAENPGPTAPTRKE